MKYSHDKTSKALEKKFMKDYGEVHLCGNCSNIFKCPRMKIQSSNKEKWQMEQLMITKVPFATNMCIEEYIPKDRKKPLKFINVYKCDKFVYEY